MNYNIVITEEENFLLIDLLEHFKDNISIEEVQEGYLNIVNNLIYKIRGC